MRFLFNKLIWLTLLPWLTGCVSGAILAGKPSLINFIHSSPVLEKGLTGLEIYDPVRKKILFEYNTHQYFIPASNTKLLTFYTGLKILGDSLPSIRYCVDNDTLYFSGMADPTLLNHEFASQPVFSFLKNSCDTLVFIPAISNESRFGPGWAWDDYPYDYSAEKSGFPVYGDVVSFKYFSGDSVLIISPPEFTDSVEIKADTISDFEGDRISRAEISNRYFVNLNHSDSLEADIPFIYHNDLAIELLKDTLGRNISIQESRSGCEWKILYSQPVDTLMKIMLHKSDNFLAEQILMACSSVLYDTLNTDRIIQYAIDSIFPGYRNNLVWVDGSGLSRYNLQTPENLVKLLDRMYREIPQKRLFSLLPGYGTDLSHELEKDDPEIFIYAKSGSMTHVYNMSGYMITGKNKLLIFSLMNNNFQGGVSQAIKESEKILKWVHERY